MKKISSKLLAFLIIAGCVAMWLLTFLNGSISEGLTYVLGTAIGAGLVLYNQIPKIKPFELKNNIERIFWILPAVVIAINNFPWISTDTGGYSDGSADDSGCRAEQMRFLRSGRLRRNNKDSDNPPWVSGYRPG